jgi:DnaJ-class molecular chaperone
MTIDFDPNVDQYKVLGVDKTASASEIKKAYRKLAKQYHPDSTGGDKAKEARFKEISAAYEVLGDDTKRKQYDEIREQIRTGGFRRGPAQGATGPGGAQVFDLSDLFAQFFAGQQGGGGGGVHFEVEDEGQGWPFGQQQRQSRRQQRRQARHGHVEPEPPTTQRMRAADGSWLTVKGQDVHSDVRLPFADAIQGTVREVATVDGSASVKIPPGTSSGQKLRLRGKGVGGAGDHYVTVHIDVPKELDDTAKKLLHELTTHLKRQGAHEKKRT